MCQNVQIKFSEPIGFCYGVKRAINLAEKALEQSLPVYTLGDLAHNKQLIKYLECKGIKTINSYEGIEPSLIVIRSHGISQAKLKLLKKSGWQVIDATCPHVRRVQNLAISLNKEGYEVFIIGDKKHPEVIGIVENIKGNVHIIQNPDDIVSLGKSRFNKIGIVVQTTQTIENVQSIILKILESQLTLELKIYNTICPATVQRQKSTLQLAKEVDIMIVVGSNTSANTSKLVLICENQGTPVYLAEDVTQIKAKWFKNINLIGITAGASTPDWLIQEVVLKIKNLTNSNP